MSDHRSAKYFTFNEAFSYSRYHLMNSLKTWKFLCIYLFQNHSGSHQFRSNLMHYLICDCQRMYSHLNPRHVNILTLTMPNFLNEIVCLTFLALSIISDIKTKTWSWSANSIKPGQTAQMCRLAWAKTNHFWCWQDKG